MHEISSESYEELRALRSKFALIRNAVLEAAPDRNAVFEAAPDRNAVFEAATPSVVKEIPEIPCCDCAHLTPNGCSFDIPEAQTTEAKGCNLFKELF